MEALIRSLLFSEILNIVLINSPDFILHMDPCDLRLSDGCTCEFKHVMK